MVPLSPADRVDDLRRRLLDAWDLSRRDLPWRADADPYRVWVSEVMLQQTRVDVVVPYYERWLARFPTVRALADAPLDDALRAWAGLGYYARARNLWAAARVVRDEHGGAVPADPARLRALPGVGAYTAGAIGAIAFGRREAAVDGNARRVLSRLFDLERPTPAALERVALGLVDPARPGDSVQALMELGATVCAPRSPDCPACPLAAGCLARARGTVALRPPVRRRAAVPTVRIATALVVSPRGRVLVARRPEGGLLGGMWEFPGIETGRAPAARAAARAAALALGREAGGASPPRRLDRVEHLFSHRRHVYDVYAFAAPDGRAPRPDARWTAAAWVAPSALSRRALSAAQVRIAAGLAP